MKKENKVQCAECPHPAPERACMTPGGKASKGCPTLGKKALVQKAKKEYQDNSVSEFARLASIQEGECYSEREKRPYIMHPVKPRMLEIVEFAQKMGYQKIRAGFLLRSCKRGCRLSTSC